MSDSFARSCATIRVVSTRTVNEPGTVIVIDPVPVVAVAGPTVAVSGMNVPALRRPHTIRIAAGIAMAATENPVAAAAISALDIAAVGRVIAVAAAGEGGSALTRPERRKSPPIAGSVRIIAELPAGGTPAEVNDKVRLEDVAVSNGVAVLPLGGGGENILPVSDGKAAL